MRVYASIFGIVLGVMIERCHRVTLSASAAHNPLHTYIHTYIHRFGSIHTYMGIVVEGTLYVVRPSIPTGPLAWIRAVDIPTSAPRPKRYPIPCLYCYVMFLYVCMYVCIYDCMELIL